uniref:LOB domain-containing protein n=1 Tax=Physcomitrium patens TaxID=3218 RepID=A0A2K1JDZ6_PHYPA|nr:hypothetical protein PHYPA_020023 [Physcomitrium patens]
MDRSRLKGSKRSNERRKKILDRAWNSKMSCNGYRVLRKSCSNTCILRPCLEWIESSDAQGHATIFVAKYFGRAGLMGIISAVHETQRPVTAP